MGSDIPDENTLSEDVFLESYNPADYASTAVAVDAAVFSVSARPDSGNHRKLDEQRLEVLLVKRTGHPFLGMRSLPGGFVREDEDTDAAVKRVIGSKTGLSDLYLEQLAVFSDPGRDPRMRVISLAYLALIDRSLWSVTGPQADSPEWFEISREPDRLTLTAGEETMEIQLQDTAVKNGKNTTVSVGAQGARALAFDHTAILLAAFERLKERIATTHIAFNLLPDKFTIARLQAIHETVLGHKLAAAAFRRKIAPSIESAGSFYSDKGNRPSREFRFTGR